MKNYIEYLNSYKDGLITEAECTLRILNYFGNNPTSWQAIQEQLNEEKRQADERWLEIDAQFLKDNF